MMKPAERRLLAGGGGLNGLLLRAGGLGVAAAVLLVAQAALLAHVVTQAFIGHVPVQSLALPVAALLGVVVARGAPATAMTLAGRAAAARAKNALRLGVARHLLALGPDAVDAESAGELATTLGEGVEALDAYFARYLPQLVLAIAVPLVLLAWVLLRDPLAALVLLVTLPLIPVFMALIGQSAQEKIERRWRALSILAAHFLDVLEGLPTLRVFGRGKTQETAIRRVTDQYRTTTLMGLRVAFLSSLVLELGATISTALVAVVIGIRLAAGELGLEAGLAVLLLAPEVYLPLRRLGTQYHARQEALAPAARLFELLDRPTPDASGRAIPDLGCDEISFEAVRFERPGRTAVLEGFELRLRPGERVALAGPSGAGKTTVLELLMGFLQPTGGRIMIGRRELSEVSLRELRAQIGWVSQAPALTAGSVAGNVRFGDPAAGPAQVRRALRLAGLRLPGRTEVGEAASAISAGQRRRLALARALVRRPRLLLLDEPAANLDPEAQADLARLLSRLPGTTVLMAAHSPILLACADRVVELGAPVGAAAGEGSAA
jgi:thiol reductant ABC exporter CydD subunit